jgi:hypothetical protein
VVSKYGMGYVCTIEQGGREMVMMMMMLMVVVMGDRKLETEAG